MSDPELEAAVWNFSGDPLQMAMTNLGVIVAWLHDVTWLASG
jgi:hypothetical protein